MGLKKELEIAGQKENREYIQVGWLLQRLSAGEDARHLQFDAVIAPSQGQA